MTTFVVSFYLPYTIDFTPTSTEEPDPRSHLVKSLLRKDSTLDVLVKPASLFATQTPPKTPAAIDYDDFFSQAQPSAATHFLKPEDPRFLVRSDSHIPEWGPTSGIIFNQPKSTAGPAPPDTILEYSKALERVQASQIQSLKKLSSKSRKERSRSRDPRWGAEWTVKPGVVCNGGLVNAVRCSGESGTLGDVLWVGNLGFPTDSLNDTRKQEIHEKMESEFDSLTVYVNDVDFDGHYAHYCKTILWPVFHYQIPDHPKSKAYEDHSWVYYEKVNHAFADKVVANYKRGDVIWVHDYHLLLVPKLIRDKLPDAKIGFFLHTAFPSSEVFRCLAVRKELLRGMLGANLVAFQTREYAHHFLQTCSRILGVEATEDAVQLDTHFVNVWSQPIGIDPTWLNKARKQMEVVEEIKAVQARYAGKRLIVARDKLDNIRGVRQKLLGFELFLNKYPEWRNKVVLIQVATPGPENTADLSATVSEIVTRIDAGYSSLAHNPLVFLRQDISFSKYLALLTVADCLMITSLREGMNLTCHEYVVCQDGTMSDKKYGPMILSEFTGSASLFEGQELSVNPWDYKKCAEAIKAALEMDEAEKERRHHGLHEIVMRNTGDFWSRGLRDQLNKVYEDHLKRDTMSIPRLSITQLITSYKESTRRLFILDYEGTLASYGSVHNTVITGPERVIEALSNLIADEKNSVYVMSGRTLEELELIFNLLPRMGLIAENGCFLRVANTEEWIAFADPEKTAEWKDAVKPTLKYHAERIEGSWIEERRCSLIFHFEKPDENASRQAGDCANQINDACESQRVKAVPTKDSIIIEPVDFNKTTAAIHIKALTEKADEPDFLMVAGNDRDDEVIFRWAKELNEKKEIPYITTVSVGNRNTEAMATLTQGTTGLINVLNKLVKL